MKALLVLAFAFACAKALSPNDIQTGNSSERIVLGKDAERYQFPYMAAIFLGASHVCGGAILTPTVVITAGHCFMYPYDHSVKAGMLDRTEKHPDNQRITVQRTVRHPDYALPYNDVVLFYLIRPLTFSQAVQPIKLPENGVVPAGNAVLTGWGNINGSIQSETNRLQWLEMPIITNEECQRMFFENQLYPHDIVVAMLCTLPIEAEQSGCKGDSGGPLVQDGVLIGLVQGGDPACGHGLAIASPNVFTRVSYYVDFIKENVQELA